MNLRPLQVRPLLVGLAALLVASLGLAARPAQAAAPAAPKSLQADEAPAGTVELDWKHSGAGVSTFQVQRRTPTGAFSTIGTTPASQREYDDTITLGSILIYRVRARNAVGESSKWSNQCWVNADPPTPGQLAAQRVAGGVRLTWADAGQFEASFELQRKEAAATRYATIATVPANTTVFLDETADASTAYDYRIRARGRPNQCIAHSKFSRALRVRPAGGCPATGPIQDLRQGCSDLAFLYENDDVEESALLTTNGSRVVITGTVLIEGFSVMGTNEVELRGPVTSATTFVIDRACMELEGFPPFCLILPIENGLLCIEGHPPCTPAPPELGLAGLGRIAVSGSLRDQGQTLHLEMSGFDIVTDYPFVRREAAH